jgi:hypothetical protein
MEPTLGEGILVPGLMDVLVSLRVGADSFQKA